MKKLLYFYSVICVLFISQITFAQAATSYHYRWSPDGSRLVVMVQNNTTIVATLYDEQWQPLASRQVPTIGLHFSPDGDSLLVSGKPAEIWDSDTLQTVRVLPAGAIWSPDGSEIVTYDSGPPRVMKIYSAADGRLLREFTASTAAAWGWPYFPLWSPNGDYFVTAVSSQLAILDAITGQQVGANYQLDGDINSYINSYNWSSDGTRIAISLIKRVPEGTVGSFPNQGSPGQYYLSSIVLLELATGTMTTLRSGLRNPASLLMWSPDDKYIATGLDGTLYIMDSANGNLIESLSLMPNFSIVGWSPDGGRLMSGLYNSATYEPTSKDDTAVSLSAPRSTFVQNQLDGLIQIFVPAPSPEKLQAITQACGVQTSVQQSLTAQITTNKLQDFTTQVSALTDAQIPPGCKADLLAVANALLAQGQ